MTPRILAFSGSARTGSLNQRLVAVAAEGARKAGAEVTLISLRDFPAPIYDGDLEEASGLPESIKKLKALMAVHQGLLIACPEYNSSITPLLKNVIDWLSRPQPNEAPLASFDGKVCGLLGASAGAFGGLRGLFHVRDILQNIRVTVLPDPYLVAVARADQHLDEEGTIKDERMRGAVENVGRRVATVIARLA
ncbi:MAG TPA: NAD(P)H-dependent oxidoreductase [Phycisphaerales bacterium]|nr:NAD(P)H-dependent oxidoreductase [Phycisphaerales bacterium]HMP36247.1 NAD(P)H-dependent oxidoreductase [Phycisphaerales bacterium]